MAAVPCNTCGNDTEPGEFCPVCGNVTGTKKPKDKDKRKGAK